MPATRSQWSALRTRVRRLIREETAGYWSDALLLDLFNDSQDHYAQMLMEQYEGWFTDTYQDDTVAGQNEYTLPEGTVKVLRVVMRFADGGSVRRVPLREDDKWYTGSTERTGAAGDNTSSGTYRFKGRLLYLQPAPPTSRTDGLEIDIACMPTRLDEDTDVIDDKWPLNAETLFVYDTACRAFAVEDAQAGGPASHLVAERDRLERQFFNSTARRAQSPRFSTPYFTGD